MTGPRDLAQGASVSAMSEPVLRVPAETRYLSETDEWEATATGGRIDDPFTMRVTAPTEEEVKQDFIPAWNERAGTSWAPDQFSFTRNYGREEQSE